MNDLFKYKYIDNKAPSTLVLFHGTGGTEMDFLFLNDTLHNSYNLLGLRGNIDENGMNRFFKRTSFGIFDQQSIKEESTKLKQFIDLWTHKYALKKEELAYLGYSNGANMILAQMFHFPDDIKKSILLHPMLPFHPKKQLDLSQNATFISYSTNDTMISPIESKKVIDVLQKNNSQVAIHTYNTGHQLSEKEIADCIAFLSII